MRYGMNGIKTEEDKTEVIEKKHESDGERRSPERKSSSRHVSTLIDRWRNGGLPIISRRGMQLGSGKLQHTSVISVKHADANKPPHLYLAPMALQNYLFGSLTDGDTDYGLRMPTGKSGHLLSIKPTSFESMLWC
ncbi:hypothetical protein NQ317_011513 [Molorchus minor]|uniref:Uncharacterized protein n=1 Tax=Molorchus minor TaxID=1323400 RepID=A0ABQ9ISM7_9CUCU|nr:hypothetical protein NQ317_011513 [Molorchus minor]